MVLKKNEGFVSKVKRLSGEFESFRDRQRMRKLETLKKQTEIEMQKARIEEERAKIARIRSKNRRPVSNIGRVLGGTSKATRKNNKGLGGDFSIFR